MNRILKKKKISSKKFDSFTKPLQYINKMGIMKDEGIFFRSAYKDQEPVQFLHDSFCSLKILLNDSEVCALPTENPKNFFPT